MTATRHRRRTFALLLALGCAVTLSAAPPAAETPKKPADDSRIPTREAKERAKLLHGVYSATLESLHHHYFKREGRVLPARAMEDIFADVEADTKIQARWIAVNTQAMSIHHEPKSDFEKKAAEELAAGKAFFEQVEKGVYHRAAPIPLGAGCVGCHTKFFSQPPKTPRMAGLVISIPVNEK
jgi:hypothetical protein